MWLVGAVAVALCACGSPASTVSGPLVVGLPPGCVYVRGPYSDYTDLYWIRRLPDGYAATAAGITQPDGTVLDDGRTVTVTGSVSSGFGDTVCVSAHIIDATDIR